MELERYSRQIMLDNIGVSGQENISKSSVCIVGAGGIGNMVALQLAAMGCGRIRIVDRDIIETSNLHRQMLYCEEDVGKPKVEVAARRLSKRNSSCVIEPVSASLNDANADSLIEGCDIVIDALDNPEARHVLNRACIRASKPLVTGAASGMLGLVFTCMPGKRCYACVQPYNKDDGRMSCGIVGVHPSLLTLITSSMTNEAVAVMTGSGPYLSEYCMYVDISTGFDFMQIVIHRNPECHECVKHRKPEVEEVITEDLCSRSSGCKTYSFTLTSHTGIDTSLMREHCAGLGYEVAVSESGSVTLKKDGVVFEFASCGSAIVTGINDVDEARETYLRLARSAEIVEQVAA